MHLGVDLGRARGQHGRDHDEAAAAVEVLLHGARDEEALDVVDYHVGPEHSV